MKKLISLLVFLPCLMCSADDQSTPYIHHFSVWSVLKTDLAKTEFVIGVTNGYFASHPDSARLYTCLANHIPYDQAVAMVDKYYKEHPEKWSNFAAPEVMNALTVDDGPCPKSFLDMAHPSK